MEISKRPQQLCYSYVSVTFCNTALVLLTNPHAILMFWHDQDKYEIAGADVYSPISGKTGHVTVHCKSTDSYITRDINECVLE